MRLLFSLAIALLATLSIQGCSGGLGTAGAAMGTGSIDAAAPPPGVEAMKLQAGDKIRVTVYGEDKLSGEYEIDPSGFVSLPLAGTLQASGLTKMALEQSLSEKFKSNYLRDPKVTVDVASFRPIYVLGE